jgi:hypothetical protein
MGDTVWIILDKGEVTEMTQHKYCLNQTSATKISERNFKKNRQLFSL